MKIKPITLLRDPKEISRLIEDGEPLIITKNGEEAMVISLPDKDTSADSKAHIYGDRVGEPSDPLGFVRVRAAPIEVKVGDVKHNYEKILEAMEEAHKDEVHVLVLPELCLTAYTCGDLFFDQTLLSSAEDHLRKILAKSKDYESLLTVIGLPFLFGGRLYNVAAAVKGGHLLALVPKANMPSYKEFYEGRYFAVAPESNVNLKFGEDLVPFGNKTILVDANYPSLKIGIEICEDLWVNDPPSTKLAQEGATLILNLSASNETVGKAAYREELVGSTSARLLAAYAYSSAGRGESSTDTVYGGHCLIYENGKKLSSTPIFEMEKATADIDLELLLAERRRLTSVWKDSSTYDQVYFPLPIKEPDHLLRRYQRNPFVPEGKIDLERVRTILRMQAEGLAQRLRAVHSHRAVVGLSGGLDSTLALLVAVEAFKLEDIPLSDISAITMPCFGTSKRTHDNAELLASSLGVSFEEINLKESVSLHLKDIGHDQDLGDIAYENAQARERTQVLLDIANSRGALMIGTGDLSELCLGWTTYNGDHMSSYGVNASIPKTLVRYLVMGYALMHPEAATALSDIAETPVSPELLPPDKEGNIAQKTEDKIGPYELHDFFIYHYLRYLYRPRKLYKLACLTFKGIYEPPFIKKWLREFFRRFFANQFKRSCLPDGAKVGTVAISPRGDWRMPSDASAALYLQEIDTL